MPPPNAGNQAVAAEIEICLAAPAEPEPPPPGPAMAAADPGGITAVGPGEPPRPGAVVDAHLVWKRQLAKLGSIDLRFADEPVLDAVCERMDHLEGLILGTPAHTLAGAMVQIERVAASMAQREGDACEPRALRLALAALAELPRA
jgi:hypothetical protein